MNESREQPKRSGNVGKGCLIIVGIIVGIGVLGMIIPPPESATQQSSGSVNDVELPPIKVTAQKLFEAYQENEAAAQQQYGDQPIEITGKVQSIGLDFRDDPFITLVTSNQFMGVHIELNDASKQAAVNVKKGQTLVAKCVAVTEMAGTPRAKDCAI